MTPLPVIENVSRVTFLWTPSGAVNVMHFHQAELSTAGLFGALDANVLGGMWQCNSTGDRVGEVRITPLDGATPTVPFHPASVTKWKGQSTGETIPAAAAVVSLHTSLRGRSNRGRVFVGPVSESSNVSGMLETSVPGTMTTAWTNFASAMIADDVEFVVASYLKSTALTVINITIRPQTGTLRRRQDKLV